MTINATAEAARENARTATGEFGAQEHTTPETKLIVNGTAGEQRLEELRQQFEHACLWHDDRMRFHSYAFPSAAADVASGVGAEQVRFEYFQLDEGDPVEARAVAVVIDGETHAVDWETNMDDLTGRQLDLRLLGERMYSMTSLFVRDDDDLDIPGLEYDYDFGMRRFTLDVAKNATGASWTEGKQRWAATADEMQRELIQDQETRRELIRELPSAMGQVFDERVPEAKSVLLHWDTDVSENSVDEYLPHARVLGYKDKDDCIHYLSGQPDEGMSRKEYAAESAASWVDEVLSYAIDSKEDLEYLQELYGAAAR